MNRFITSKLVQPVRILVVLLLAVTALVLPLGAGSERSIAEAWQLAVAALDNQEVVGQSPHAPATYRVDGESPSKSPVATDPSETPAKAGGNITHSDIITHYLFLPLVFGTDPDLVFFDDFSDPNSGWPDDLAWEDCYFEYYDNDCDGCYRVKVTHDQQRCMVPNFRIPEQVNGTYSVKVRRTSDKDEEVLYGFIFGAAPDATQDRWTLQVFPDKDSACDDKPFFWLSAHVDGDREYFKDQCTDTIQTGNQWNELKVVRDGKKIKVYMNGYLKGNYDDAKYLLDKGYFLLDVISLSDKTVIVEFDDFTIRSDIAP